MCGEMQRGWGGIGRSEFEPNPAEVQSKNGWAPFP